MFTVVLIILIIVLMMIFSWRILSSPRNNIEKQYKNKKVKELLNLNHYALRDEFKKNHPIPKGSYLLNFTDMDAGMVMSDNHPSPVIAATFGGVVSEMKRVEAHDDENEIRIMVYDSNYEVVYIKYEYKKIGNSYPNLLSGNEMTQHFIQKGCYLLEYEDETGNCFFKTDSFTDALRKIQSFEKYITANVYDSNYDVVFYQKR
jgi:hypothetical protein